MHGYSVGIARRRNGCRQTKLKSNGSEPLPHATTVCAQPGEHVSTARTCPHRTLRLHPKLHSIGHLAPALVAAAALAIPTLRNSEYDWASNGRHVTRVYWIAYWPHAQIAPPAAVLPAWAVRVVKSNSGGIAPGEMSVTWPALSRKARNRRIIRALLSTSARSPHMKSCRRWRHQFPAGCRFQSMQSCDLAPQLLTYAVRSRCSSCLPTSVHQAGSRTSK